MHSTAIANETLDRILALQFTLGWAGEGLCEPARLKWWRTDLVDEYGGGDFLQRLLPRTHRWAGLECVRRAAFLTDLKSRSHMSDPDSVISLYFWGFELDEKLTERIRELKGSQVPPEEALSFPVPVLPTAKFDRTELERELGPQPPYQSLPTGRELPGPVPSDLAEAARLLAAAHLPFTENYPAPFFRR